MAKCTRIRPKNRRLCVGDLNKACTLWDRDLKAPKHDTTESTHDYTNDDPVFCALETVSGTEVFDSSNQLIGVITHRFYIQVTGRAISTASTRVEFGGRYFEPLKIMDIDERGEFLRLDCGEVGATSKASNR